MISTPIWSRSSATSSFSSCVIVAPGDCSPSRKVVSKITTRSFSDFGDVVMETYPCGSRPGTHLACEDSSGFLGRLADLLFEAFYPTPECQGVTAQPALRG